MTDTPQAPPDASAAPATPAPSTPAEAAAKLETLRADPKWTEALLGGGLAQKNEWQNLHELAAKGDGVDLAVAGLHQPGPIQDSEHVENMGVAAMMKELGIRPEITKEFLTGHTETKKWYDEVARFKADKMSDPIWVKALMSGSIEARRQLTLCNIVLSGEIKDGAA
jgi:hypothetical protein